MNPVRDNKREKTSFAIIISTLYLVPVQICKICKFQQIFLKFRKLTIGH